MNNFHFEFQPSKKNKNTHPWFALPNLCTYSQFSNHAFWLCEVETFRFSSFSSSSSFSPPSPRHKTCQSELHEYGNEQHTHVWLASALVSTSREACGHYAVMSPIPPLHTHTHTHRPLRPPKPKRIPHHPTEWVSCAPCDLGTIHRQHDRILVASEQTTQTQICCCTVKYCGTVRTKQRRFSLEACNESTKRI